MKSMCEDLDAVLKRAGAAVSERSLQTRPAAEKARLRASWIRAVSDEIRGAYANQLCGYDYGLYAHDVVLLQQWAVWAEYDAELEEWRSNPNKDSAGAAQHIIDTLLGRGQPVPKEHYEAAARCPPKPSRPTITEGPPTVAPVGCPDLNQVLNVNIGWGRVVGLFLENRAQTEKARRAS